MSYSREIRELENLIKMEEEIGAPTDELEDQLTALKEESADATEFERDRKKEENL